MKDTLPYTLTVYLEDTDAGGFVYHANYLKYMERARTMLLYHKGIDHAQLIKDHHHMFVVYTMAIQFLSAAKLGDTLQVFTTLDSITGARATMNQSIVREGKLLVKANVTLAYIDQASPTSRPVRIPKFITRALDVKILEV